MFNLLNLITQERTITLDDWTILNVPKVCSKKLEQLIIKTGSMDNKEKQEWFNMLNAMNKEQIDRFIVILEKEVQFIKNSAKEYEKEVKEMNEKHTKEWEDYAEKLKKKNK